MEVNGVYGKASETVDTRSPLALGVVPGTPLVCAPTPFVTCWPFIVESASSLCSAASLRYSQ